ncbi:MAG TPA: ABC transporter permease [Anaerolinea thermolimosa]|uniref:ABC transporter permease n=1 Tax=Anaerolinea thermolimosa TaxID=229919 RepID=A0A3D1JGZ5_9CHLR|nr:ABC transporter permease [Anaerolinea thermolimosa]GAP08487.1 nucleoside ABC transporter membrane protein [Anaerolinea thermolimosa]HCE17763.1 ABC transporter permease [Anaerolinea thermolimosa]
MATIVVHRKWEAVSPTRQRVMGLVELGSALIMLLVFTLKVQPGQMATFVMTPGGLTQGIAGNWVVPAFSTLMALTVVNFLLGMVQLVRGFGRWTNAVLGVVVAFFVFSFLTWATAGKSLNLLGMLSAAVLLAVPIILGAFSGVLCERAGVVNIAIEGMMLMAAMVGALVGSVTKNMWMGLLAAVASSVLLAWVHAVLSIKYKINQIISGTVINIFSTGMTSYLSSKFLQTYQELNNPPIFPRVPIPLLADIPILGPLFFNTNLFVYLVFLLLIILQVALFTTRWGLRLRSVGEHPKAADTLGINVFATRYMAVLLGGVVAGIGGAFFTLGSVGRFDEMMTAGKGFIGLAAMIFGNWTPLGAFFAGLLFGFTDSVATKLTILGTGIPIQFMAMAPYITTMVVLAGLVGRGQMPAADGTPYEKE